MLGLAPGLEIPKAPPIFETLEPDASACRLIWLPTPTFWKAVATDIKRGTDMKKRAIWAHAFQRPLVACYNGLSAVDGNSCTGFLVRQLPSANT